MKPGYRGTGAAVMFATLSAISYAQSPPTTADPEIVTDRPDVTESSIVVPKGNLQIENGMTWTSDHGSQNFDLSESLMRFGVSTRTEIRIVVPNFLGGISGPDTVSGFGDIALGMKQQLGPSVGRVGLSHTIQPEGTGESRRS
jgi:hypothetical protein